MAKLPGIQCKLLEPHTMIMPEFIYCNMCGFKASAFPSITTVLNGHRSCGASLLFLRSAIAVSQRYTYLPSPQEPLPSGCYHTHPLPIVIEIRPMTAVPPPHTSLPTPRCSFRRGPYRWRCVGGVMRAVSRDHFGPNVQPHASRDILRSNTKGCPGGSWTAASAVLPSLALRTRLPRRHYKSHSTFGPGSS